MKRGDIVMVHFHFEDDPKQSKFRPALVWDLTAVSVKLIFVTSQGADGYDTERGVVGLNEQEAKAVGLLKPSKINFHRVEDFPFSDVSRRVGNIYELKRPKMRELFEAAKAAHLL